MIINFTGVRIRNFIALSGQMLPRYAEFQVTLHITEIRFESQLCFESKEFIGKKNLSTVKRLITG